MALISQKGGVMPPAQSSRPQNTAVGSGARPTPSKVKIDTSAPTQPYNLGRLPSVKGGEVLK